MSQSHQPNRYYRDPEYCHPLEVVLSILIESFRFSPAEKEIDWHMIGLATPTVPGSPLPQLPIRVEKVAWIREEPATRNTDYSEQVQA